MIYRDCRQGRQGPSMLCAWDARFVVWTGACLAAALASVIGLALVPLLLALGMFAILAKDKAATPQRLRDCMAVLAQADTWFLCFFYAITFGGYVGLASYLTVYCHGQFEVSWLSAGLGAALCVLAGSGLRRIGSSLAEQTGGIRVLTLLFTGIGLLLLDLATAPPLAWSTIVLVLLTGLLGLGNGAVLQMVPQRFPSEIAAVTRVVGAAGGTVGLLLPLVLGGVRQYSGSFSSGLVAFALIAFAGAVLLVRLSESWLAGNQKLDIGNQNALVS